MQFEGNQKFTVTLIAISNFWTMRLLHKKNMFIPVLDLLVSYASSWMPSIIIVVISVQPKW